MDTPTSSRRKSAPFIENEGSPVAFSLQLAVCKKEKVLNFNL